MPRRLFFKESNNLGVAFPGYSIMGFNTSNYAVKTDESGVVKPIESSFIEQNTLENTLILGASGGTASISINGVYNLPTTDGENGQVLTTDGSGNLGWTQSTGGASSAKVFYFRYRNALTFNSPPTLKTLLGTQSFNLGEIAGNAETVILDFSNGG